MKILLILLLSKYGFSQEPEKLAIIDSPAASAKLCTPLVTPVKYFVRKDEHIASILRYARLEPIWCKGCSLDKVLSLNNLPNKNFIKPGLLLQMPFDCEEDTWPYNIITQKDYRALEVPIEVATSKNWIRPAGFEQKLLQNKKSFLTSDNEKTRLENARVRQVSAPINDWSKIDCNGQIYNDSCLSKTSILFAKIKNSILDYSLEDRVRSESNHLRSILTPGALVGFNKYLNRYWSVMGEFELMYQKVESDSASVSQSRNILANFTVDARYEFKKWDFGLGFKRGEYIYFYPTGVANDAEIYALLFVEVLSGYRWIDTENELFKSEVSVDFGTSALGRSLELKTGQIINLKNEYRRKNNEGFYAFGVDVVRHEQPTSSTYQSYWGLSLSVGVGWNLGMKL